MEYYSRKNGDKLELLEEHLNKTGKLSSEYMSKFGMPVTGKLIGNFHDLGKHTTKFKNVLEGKATKVNHAIVGGIFSKNILERDFKELYLSDIISSHHHGLTKWDNSDYSYKSENIPDRDGKENALSSAEELKEIIEYIKEHNYMPTEKELDIFKKEYKNIYSDNLTKNEIMLINRMIFSCLVDADYSASISFVDESYLDTYEEKLIDCDKLINKLENYKKNLSLNSKADKRMNELRDKVYNSCVEKTKTNYTNYSLTAPTGTGKTLALIAFGLYKAKLYNKERIFIILPYLSITEQVVNEFKNIFGEDVVFEDDSTTIFTEETKHYSERWAAPIIVTTSVNFFESLYKTKGSDIRKIHNITNSVVIFDESQSLPDFLIDSTLETINILNKKFGVITLFSTATPPSFNYRKNVKWNPHEIIENPQKLYDDYSKIKNTKVEWRVDKETKDEELIEELKNKNSFLVILNLKKHANDVFEKLKESGVTDGLYYISTNLCSAHRSDILKEIKERLKAGLPTKVISTQCLEAGVDVDFEWVYRALAPATSIAQASGRTNRNCNFKNGNLVIFIPEKEKKYPTNNYENATTQLKSILNKDKNFDINNLSDIDNYFYYLYNTYGFRSDAKTLLDNIENEDYEAVSKEYKFIKNDNCTIIVPYKNKTNKYSEIKEKLQENDYCISKQDMKLYRSISVSVFKSKDIENFCIPLYFNINGEKYFCNWYLLDCNTEYYDDNLGLNFKKENDFIF